MAVHGLGYRNAPYQMDPNFDWGLCRDAFHSCDGFTYNVTRRDSIPKFQELKMVTGKSPKICSRSISDRNSIRIQNEFCILNFISACYEISYFGFNLDGKST